MLSLKAFCKGLSFFALALFLGFSIFSLKVSALSVVFDSSTEFATGTFDGVTNSSPNETPIVQLKSGEIPSSVSNLEAQWNFNETSGTTITNLAGSSSCGGTAANCNILLGGIPDTTGQDKISEYGLSLINSKWGGGALDLTTTGVSSLLHGDGANSGTVFSDEGGKTWTAAGNTVTSTTSPAYGTASLYFPGTSDTLTSGVSADYNFGTSPFTIDFMLKTTKTTGYGGILQHNATYTAANAWLVYQNGTSLQFWMGGSALLTKVGTWSDGNWHHIAITRSGTTLKMYIDGTSVNTYTDAAVGTYSFGSSSIGLLMGTQYGFLGTRDFAGNVDELRITKGRALWSANFTSPTTPLFASVADPASNSLDPSSNFSIETWVKTSKTNSTIISNNNNNLISCTSNGYYLGTNSSGYPVFYVDANGTTAGCEAYVLGNTLITDSIWHHLVVTYDQANSTAKIYLDGEIIGEDKTVAASATSATGNIYFASNGTVLDSTRFYSRTLSSSEIKNNYSNSTGVYTSSVIDLGVNVASIDSILWSESGVKTGDGETPFSSTDLVTQWNLNSTSGTTATNDAGVNSCGGTPSNCNGTLTNFASTSSQDQAIGTGWTSNNKKWGTGALMFDGTNDYVNTGYTKASGDGTLAMWFKLGKQTNFTTTYIRTMISQGAWNGTNSGIGIATWCNGLTTTGKLKFMWGIDNATDQFTTKDRYDDGEWHYVVLAKSGTVLSIYMDGDLLGTQTASDTVNTSTAFQIGGSSTSAERSFNGIIDSTSIYSRVLSPSEILSNYQSSNIEFETRTSADGVNWEAWAPAANTQINSLDADQSNWGWDGSTTYAPNNKTDDSVIFTEGTGSLALQQGVGKVDANTIGLWNLDETNTSGNGVIKDSTSNLNNMTLKSGTTLVDGIASKARYFDGTDDYLCVDANSDSTCDDPSSLKFVGPITVSAWIKPEDLTGTRVIASKSGGLNVDTQYELRINGTSAQFKIGNAAGSFFAATYTSALSVGSWYHVAGTFDGTTLRVYVNGVLGETTATFTGTQATNTEPFVIGARGIISLSGETYFQGVIDEVQVSNIAWNQEQLVESYRLGNQHTINKTITTVDLAAQTKLPIWVASDRMGGAFDLIAGESAYSNYETDSNTVGFWRMEETTGTGAYIKDSANSRHATPTGTSSVPGIFGKGRYINAENIAASLAADPGYANTIDLWIKPVTSIASKVILTTSKLTTNASSQPLYGGCTGSAIPLGVWTHLVAVSTDSTNCAIYQNGALVSTGSTGVTFGTSVGIGQSSFIGTVDEVRISKIARTAAEIRQSYEVGKRTHSVVVDFGASGASSNLIIATNGTSSSDLSFNIDGTLKGMAQKANNLNIGDRIIIRENYNGTQYSAQGIVDSVNASTGAVTVSSWLSGSTFPQEGTSVCGGSDTYCFSQYADVFKWQQEWIDLSGARADDIDAITNISVRLKDGTQGRNIWLDDFNIGGPYLTDSTGSTLTSTAQRYVQFRAIVSTTDSNVTPSIESVTLNYTLNTVPNSPTILDHFDGTKITTAPTLGFNLSDSDTNNTVKYSIEVATDNVFTTPQIQVTGTLAAQGDIYYDTTGGGLTDGNWFWRVKATDNYDASSDWTNATTDGSPAFIIDASAPTGGSFTINSGATYTRYTSSTLNITCPTDSWATVQMAYGTSANPTNWETCATSASQTLTSGDGLKTVYVRFKDGGDNTTSDYTQTITLDQTSPSAPSALTSDDAFSGFIGGAFTADIPTGSTDTGGSGVATYSLNRCDDSGLSTNCEVIASGVSGTTTEVSGVDLPTNGNTKYYFWISVDNAENTSDSSTAIGLTMDTDKPTTAVTITEDTYYAATWVNANTINGTASDSSGSGVDMVELTIQRDFDSKYWTGSTWSDTESWVEATSGTTTWDYSIDDTNFDDNYVYSVVARATDLVGNTTSAGFGSDSFTYMNEAPPPDSPTPTPSPTPTVTPTITATPIPGGNVITNVETGIVPVLVTDWETNLEIVGQTNTKTVGVEDTLNSNIKIAEMDVDFNTSPSWAGVTGATNENIAYFHSNNPISTITNGAATTYSLYVRKGEGDKVWICPGATSLNEVNINCSGGYYLSENQTLNGATATVVSIESVAYWKISGLTSTGGMSVLTGLKDTLTRLEVATPSDHKITFGTTFGLTVGSSETMVLSFPEFDLTDITISDIELTDNVGAIRILAGSAGENTWGVSINTGAKTISFSVPTSGTGGFTPAAQIVVKIGLNVTGGENQITNPSTVGSKTETITLNNTPGETGEISIPIVDSDTVTITGYVTAYINFDIDTGTTDNIDCAFNECLAHSGGYASNNYTVDLGELTSSVVNKSQTNSQHSDGAAGLINSIYFDLTTNAPGGAVVTVKSANAGLQGPATNKIQSIGVGSGSDGDDIPANSGRYGYTLQQAPTTKYGLVTRDPNCITSTTYCGPTLTEKFLFSSSNNPIEAARVRMDLAAASSYVNNPGNYTDTLTFIVTGTF
jgi:hypothetical protein